MRTGTALKAGRNVLMVHGASTTQKCVMERIIVVMDQMSGTQHVKAALKLDPGNVLMILSALVTLMCVMETMIVMMDQMSGITHVRTALKLDPGNVLMVLDAFLTQGFVMGLHGQAVMTDQMSQLRPVVVLKSCGNVLIVQSASKIQRFVMDSPVVRTIQMSGLRLVGTALEVN